jgi:hypothetical protein
MRRLLLITAAMVLFNCSTGLAQVGGAPSAMPQVSPPPAGSPGSALGAIQPSVASPVPNSGVGAISQCTANGTANSAGTTADFSVDATDATASASSGFDASEASPMCGATSTPPPTPGLVSPPDFASGAVPLGTTEAGGSGLSPLIAGPFPQTPPTTCSGTTTSELTGTSELTSDPMSMSEGC